MKKKKSKLSVIVNIESIDNQFEKYVINLQKQSLIKNNLIEVIFVITNHDDENLLKEKIKQYPNIRIIKAEKNYTNTQCLNLGISHSRGEFITISKITDTLTEYSLEKMYNVLFNAPSLFDVVYTDLYYTNIPNDSFESNSEKSLMEWINFDKDLIHLGCFIGPKPMWRASLHNKYGNFDESLKYGALYEFWLRISQKVNFYHIQEPLVLIFDPKFENDIEENTRIFENKNIEEYYLIRDIVSQDDLHRLKEKFEYVSKLVNNVDYSKSGTDLIKRRRLGLELERKIYDLVDTFEDSPINAVFEAISNYLNQLKGKNVLLDSDKMAGVLCALKGSCYLMHNQPDEAKKMFDIAVEYDPSNEEYFKNYNILETDTADKDPGIIDKNHFINSLTKALENLKDDKYMESLEILLSLEKSYSEEEGKNSLKIKISELKEMMGFCNLGVGDLESAHECFKTALEYNPVSTFACSGLGKVFYLIEDYEMSKTMYEWAIKNNSNNTFATKGLEEVNNKLGNTPEHFSLEEGYVSTTIEEAETLIQQGNYVGAEEILQSILEKDPEHISAINDLSVIKILQNDYQKSANLINRVITIDATNDVAIENLQILENLVNTNLERVSL